MTIKINGVEYKIKYTIRAMFVFEQITERNFELKTSLDNYLFFYSLITANNPSKHLDWDEFLDAVDSDPELTKSLLKFLSDYAKSQAVFEKDDSETGEKKN